MLRSKTILLFFVVLLLSFPARAQLVHSFGFEVGATISDITIPDIKPTYGNLLPDYPNQAAFSSLAGIFIRNESIPSIPMNLELMYTRMGGSKTYTIPSATVQNPDSGFYSQFKTEMTFQYLILGLSAQPTVPLAHVALYAKVGGSLSYLVETLTLSATNRFIPGYYLGVGVSFLDLVSQSIFFEVGYSGHFTYFNNAGYGHMYNRALFIKIGVSL